MHLFSSAFDDSAVDFLEQMNVPAHKVASFELVDIGLIQKMARTGKPLIMSTGMASAEEISEAVEAARGAGATQIALLKCTSAYPHHQRRRTCSPFPNWHAVHCPVGLSDHTMGVAVPVAAVALGACIIEKHLCLRRADGGPDAAFSLEPRNSAMVEAVRTAEKALGSVQFVCGPREANSRKFRRSLFVVEDVKKGELFTQRNVRSIRPADGLHPRHFNEVLGKHAACDVERGTPLSWALVAR